MARHVFDLTDLWNRIVSYVNARLQSLSDLTEDDIREVCDFEEGMNEENVIPKASADLLGCVKVGDGLNVDENGVLSNKAADYIVERGALGIWKYEKYASGKLELWNVERQHVTGTASGSSTLGYDAFCTLTMPSIVRKIEHVSGVAFLGAAWGILSGWGYTAGTEDKAATLTLYVSGDNNAQTDLRFQLRVTAQTFVMHLN